MNTHFELEDVGKYKHICVRNAFADGEEKENFFLARQSETAEGLYSFGTNLIKNKFLSVYCNSHFASKSKQHSLYRHLELREDWKRRLLDILEQYENKEEVPMRLVIQNVYHQINIQKSFKQHLLCYKINNEKSLDMYGIFTRILFPIERIQGDITTMYKYKEKYIVIREFINNRIYVIDFFDNQYRNQIWTDFHSEKKYCNLNITFVEQESEYYQTIYLADEKRINVILDKKSSETERAIAKGIR